MKLIIADPPYLGRAVRYYGPGGCGDGYGVGQADQHPEACLWDCEETHKDLVRRLETECNGYAIAMSVHSLSTYLSVVGTDSRNGIRVGVWHKPSALPSGSRIQNLWEPVLFKVPKERRGYRRGPKVRDVLISMPLRTNFKGAKPPSWTKWCLDILGYTNGDEVVDMFHGSGAVTNELNQLRHGNSGPERPSEANPIQH